MRRALSNNEGEILVDGDRSFANELGRILEDSKHDTADRLTHGFHTWAARMHPAIARGVISLTGATRVLDPFMGSGTVLLEAMLAGAKSYGVDLNPIAKPLASVKTRVTSPREREAFLAAAEGVLERSFERIEARVPIEAKLERHHRGLYGTHTLKELAGLLEEIRVVEHPDDRRALAMIFSAIVVKFSNKMGDTSDREERKRIRKGLPTEFFGKKAVELSDRWAELAREVPRESHTPLFQEGDARNVKTYVGRRRFELVLTSPPYGGTYDYADQHALRLDWLGFPADELRKHEIGDRRRLSDGARSTSAPQTAEEKQRRFDVQTSDLLAAMRSVLVDARSSVVLVVGDAEVAGRRIDAREQLAEIGEQRGLRYVASASIERLDWHGGRPRLEHLVVLRPLGL